MWRATRKRWSSRASTKHLNASWILVSPAPQPAPTCLELSREQSMVVSRSRTAPSGSQVPLAFFYHLNMHGWHFDSRDEPIIPFRLQGRQKDPGCEGAPRAHLRGTRGSVHEAHPGRRGQVQEAVRAVHQARHHTRQGTLSITNTHASYSDSNEYSSRFFGSK